MHSATTRRGPCHCVPAGAITALAVAAAVAGCSSSNGPVPTTMKFVNDSGMSATVGTALAAPLAVSVTDQNGSPLSGVLVAFDPTAGAVIGSTPVRTDASGTASTTLTLGTTSGVDSVYAWVDSIPGPAMFAVTAVPGAATTLLGVSGNSQTGTPGGTLINNLIVQVQDAYGNGVPGVAVNWVTTAGTLTAASAGRPTPAALCRTP